MQLMTMIAISLLAGFIAGALVWLTWSIIEILRARRAAVLRAAAEKASLDAAAKRETAEKEAKGGKAPAR